MVSLMSILLIILWVELLDYLNITKTQFEWIIFTPLFIPQISFLIGILLMVSGIFLGYEMKHLITGETVNIDAYKIVENALSMEEGVKDVNSIKIVSIGTDKYLGIVKVDYLDSFTDLEIIDLNKKIEESVKTTDSRFSHLYLIPA